MSTGRRNDLVEPIGWSSAAARTCVGLTVGPGEDRTGHHWGVPLHCRLRTGHRFVQPIGSGCLLSPPSWAHLLGTTQTGQDVLSQMLVGTRTSVVVGLVAGTLATFIGVIVGMAAGYLGGTSDDLLSLVTNVFIVIPALPLLIMVTAYIKNAGDLVIAVVIALLGWAFTGRLIRAQTLSLHQAGDFILAARASGRSFTPRLLWSEIMPNVGAIIASGFLFSVILAILTQASLAFLGLGETVGMELGDDSLLGAEQRGAVGGRMVVVRTSGGLYRPPGCHAIPW